MLDGLPMRAAVSRPLAGARCIPQYGVPIPRTVGVKGKHRPVDAAPALHRGEELGVDRSLAIHRDLALDGTPAEPVTEAQRPRFAHQRSGGDQLVEIANRRVQRLEQTYI